MPFGIAARASSPVWRAMKRIQRRRSSNTGPIGEAEQTRSTCAPANAWPKLNILSPSSRLKVLVFLIRLRFMDRMESGIGNFISLDRWISLYNIG